MEEHIDFSHFREVGSTGFQRPSAGLAAVIRGFKGAATTRARRVGVRPDLVIWQRGFHEHVIRDEEDLYRIREYIQANPERWAEDRENPARGN
jgi:REP element-mobilizing transposase RayT